MIEESQILKDVAKKVVPKYEYRSVTRNLIAEFGAEMALEAIRHSRDILVKKTEKEKNIVVSNAIFHGESLFEGAFESYFIGNDCEYLRYVLGNLHKGRVKEFYESPLTIRNISIEVNEK